MYRAEAFEAPLGSEIIESFVTDRSRLARDHKEKPTGVNRRARAPAV
jgi:hypothetical protein